MSARLSQRVRRRRNCLSQANVRSIGQRCLPIPRRESPRRGISDLIPSQLRRSRKA